MNPTQVNGTTMESPTSWGMWVLAEGIIIFFFLQCEKSSHLLFPTTVHLNPKSLCPGGETDFQGHILLELISTVDSNLSHVYGNAYLSRQNRHF